ncbi:VOC family protein [uncultured Phenylobacterium sp.]|uniref:VOC family protein n=1 Tax=uncultured Phenylobacterium sp. TaxID=349273 RepID=UPI0025FDF9BD|nr:VOC family protein [uncultured Phenylobacterium sp.]
MAARPGVAIDPLKKRAKLLHRRVRAGDAGALHEARLHPRYRGGVDGEAFKLADALLVVAREQGFESWPKLISALSGDEPMTITFNGMGERVWVRAEAFEASADFYGDTLGLKCTFRSAQTATFELGFGPTIVLEVFDPDEEPGHENLAGRFTGLSLRVADLAAAYETLSAAGVPFLAPPERQAWGGIMTWFTDPGGNTHTLLERP